MLRNRVIRQMLQSRFFCSMEITPKKENTPISLIQRLSVEFEDVSCIIHALENSELNYIHFDEWKSRIYTLKKYHFSDRDCFKMISKYPCLLKIPLEKFTETTGQWFAADLSMNKVHLMLLKNPYLCEVDVIDIRKRLPKLRVLFRTADALSELLISSPNVMYDNWDLIMKKVDYLTKLKGYKMGDVLHSNALSKSFGFIKFRFDLLEKCGIYRQDNTPVHKINKYDKSRFVNPDLKSILELNLNNFISIAKISSEEYATCKDLFTSEEFEDENDDDEGD